MAECGCGRSPTGQCIGWHNLSEEEYQQKLKEHQEKAKEEKDEDRVADLGPCCNSFYEAS